MIDLFLDPHSFDFAGSDVGMVANVDSCLFVDVFASLFAGMVVDMDSCLFVDVVSHIFSDTRAFDPLSPAAPLVFHLSANLCISVAVDVSSDHSSCMSADVPKFASNTAFFIVSDLKFRG